MGVSVESPAAAATGVVSIGEEATELARTLAQIHDADPVGAAALGYTIGLPSDVPRNPPTVPVDAHEGTVGTSIFSVFAADQASEDFDVDMTLAIAVVGNPMVGKTSLIQRFTLGTFTELYQKTIVARFVEKRKVLAAASDGSTDDAEVVFHIWDASGSDAPTSLIRGACSRAKAFVVAFSTDDRTSFEVVEGWVHALRDAHGADVVLGLVQTKVDLSGGHDARVTDSEVESLALRLGLELTLSSARDNIGSSEPFERIGMKSLMRARLVEERFRKGEAVGGLQWGDAGPGGGAAWADSAVVNAAPAVVCEQHEDFGDVLDLLP